MSGRRWYRILKADGSLWCETSDPVEARAALRKIEGGIAEVCEVKTVWTSWEPWDGRTR